MCSLTSFQGEKRWDENGGPGPKLVICGQTEDGRPVVDFFHIIDSYGVPIGVVLESFLREGFVPGWTVFIESSLDKGWNLRSTIVKLETAILDVYGKDYLNEWRKRIDELLGE